MIRSLSLLGLLFAAFSSVASAADKPLNVLFIAVDDMNCDAGCYGHPEMHTPNIDRLAKRGVKFDRAYCQFPLCSPSRTSLMTGLRPDTTQVFDLRKHFREVMPNVVTLSQCFMQGGYFAARVGKIYHYGNPGDIGTPGLDDAPSWNVAINPRGRDKEIENDIINYTPKRGLGSAMSYLEDTGKDEEHTDSMVAAEAIKLLQQHKDKPFFIAAGFYKPHTPYVAPKHWFEHYPIGHSQVAELAADEREGRPKGAYMSTQPWPWFGVDQKQASECKRAYHAVISFADSQVGKLIDEMDRLKLWDSTVVVFWSDHGYHVGDHGLWMKQSLFENSAHVPLVIVAPNAKGNGQSCVRTVEFVDLYPTLADLAGLKAPGNLAGKSLKPLLEDPKSKWDKPAFTQVWRGAFAGHSVRTERYRYTEWDGGKEGTELYDYETDPKERKNLAGDAKHADVVAQLKTLVQKNWATEFKPAAGGKKKGKGTGE